MNTWAISWRRSSSLQMWPSIMSRLGSMATRAIPTLVSDFTWSPVCGVSVNLLETRK